MDGLLGSQLTRSSNQNFPCDSRRTPVGIDRPLPLVGHRPDGCSRLEKRGAARPGRASPRAAGSGVASVSSPLPGQQSQFSCAKPVRGNAAAGLHRARPRAGDVHRPRGRGRDPHADGRGGLADPSRHGAAGANYGGARLAIRPHLATFRGDEAFPPPSSPDPRRRLRRPAEGNAGRASRALCELA